MLILVATTVSYGIKSGLFEEANLAGVKETFEQAKEILMGVVSGAYNAVTGQIDDEGEKEIRNIAKEKGWKMSAGNAPWEITINNNIFIVYIDGTIEEYESKNEWIEKNLKDRGIITSNQEVAETNLAKIANAMSETNLSVNCFTVYNELQADDSTKETVAFLYGKVYEETLVEGDGTVSYNARKAKFEQLNTLTDGMLFGDLNENGKIDEEDVDLIEIWAMDALELLPKVKSGEHNTVWAFNYYAMLVDVDNVDYSPDLDDSVMLQFILNGEWSCDIVRAYNCENYEMYEDGLIEEDTDQ